jgi:hypothetical protein
MTPYIQHADHGDENDSERDDLCSRCGEMLEPGYACGDCVGGTERDPQARSWETAAWPFDRMN